jgi:DNA-binding NarL/FixJ family response regulator
VIHAGQQLRRPSDVGPSALGGRWRMPQRAEVADPRDALSCTGTDSVIRPFPRLAVAQRDAPSTREREESGVTTEELNILMLMAEGLTLDSVAVRVAMSPRTLSRRLRCVCDRLGVAHPIQAIVWAAHRGLL